MPRKAPATSLWYLRRIKLLDDVDRAQLERTARLLALNEIPRGETILLNRDRVAARVYFLFRGKVGISRIDPDTGKEIMLYLVRIGEPFGQLSSTPHESESIARVLAKSLIGSVDKQEFLRLTSGAAVNPRLKKLLESRLIRLETRLEELAFCDVPTRLARLLVRLSEDFPGRCPDDTGSLIAVNLTQQEIGNLIAASREITSLTLNEFRRDGWIVRHGRRLCIHDAAALEKMTAGS